MNYDGINDYELLMGVSEDEEYTSALFKKYQPLIVGMAKRIYYSNQNLGFDLNDLIQEGMIGFSVAINTFNNQKNTMFYTYAKTCIERKFISILKSANRFKYQPLNDSYFVENFTSDKLEFLFEDRISNPEFKLIDSENTKEIVLGIKDELTNFESAVFELKINGFTYKEISEILNKDKKAIDNAITRIKTKVTKYINKKNKF